MVYSCAVVECETGYRGRTPPRSDGVSCHSFPLNNAEVLAKWLRVIGRKDFVPNEHTRICSLHFKPEDFQQERRDTNNYRSKNYQSLKLTRKRLNPDAVPSIFPRRPKYMDRKLSQNPTHTATDIVVWPRESKIDRDNVFSREQIKKENYESTGPRILAPKKRKMDDKDESTGPKILAAKKRRIDEEGEKSTAPKILAVKRLKKNEVVFHGNEGEEQIWKGDRLNDLTENVDDIENRLRSKLTTASFGLIRKGSSLLICWIEEETQLKIPRITACLTVREDLEFSVYYCGRLETPERIAQKFPGSRIERFSEILDLIEELKTMIEEADFN